jgi:hypothetical protein
MQPTAESGPSTIRLTRFLVGVALLLWMTSLVLPSFVVLSRVGPMYGAATLMSGLLFGWAVAGWAAYANLFFGYAALQLARGKETVVAIVAMFALGLLIVTFRGVIRDEGSGTVLPVVSWGWGALLWGYSLLVMALAAAARANILHRLTATVCLSVLVATAIAVAVIGHGQRERANLQEQELYLPSGIAFTLVPFTGLPFAWPSKAAVPAGEEVAFEVDDFFAGFVPGRPYLFLPTPQLLRQHGSDWRVFHYGAKDMIKVRQQGQLARYVLQVKQVKDRGSIKLLDSERAAPLYEQPLVLRFGNAQTDVLPFSNGWTHASYTVQAAVSRALGVTPQQRPALVKLSDEGGNLPCNPKSQQGTIPNLAKWDGRDVIVDPAIFERAVALCSSSYIAVIRIRAEPSYSVVGSQVVSARTFSPVVRLYDRKTLAPIGNFVDGKPCQRDCEGADPVRVRRFRIRDQGALIESEAGELPAPRFF